MTEVDWRSGTNPTPMLKAVQSTHTRRTALLFSCACCRRLWDILPSESQEAAEVAERFADGSASRVELHRAYARASAAVLALPSGWSFELVRLRSATSAVADCCSRIAGTIPGAISIARSVLHAAELNAAVTVPESDFAFTRDVARMTEQAAQADLVREIFGNPYRLPRFDPAWRTDTAVAIAAQIYQSREFGAMPILADALQDAGCDSDDILAHCRGTGEADWPFPVGLPDGPAHVRGCWVLDLVLGQRADA